MKTIQLDGFEKFQNVTKGYNIEINSTQLNLFKKYFEILLDWNKKINLISRKEENILEKHFLDSILFLPEIDILVIRHSRLQSRQGSLASLDTSRSGPSAASFVNVLDIGSGGGFPAIPLAIMKPEWHFTLCESIKKKTGFLEHLTKEIDLKNVKIINVRVETLPTIDSASTHRLGEAGEVRSPHFAGERHTTSPYKNKFNFVTARAITDLQVLIKYSLPLLNKNGFLIAYKSKNVDKEINDAKSMIKKKN